MKHVLRYTSAEPLDMAQVQELFPAHSARWELFRERGELLAIGPFEDPREGALAVFTTREAAEEFATDDPFVVQGIVASYTITGWDEVLLDQR